MSFFSKLLEGSGKGLLDGVSGIIAKFKADPTKVMEAENELEKLKLSHEENLKKLDNDLEAEFTKRIESENLAISDRWKADMGSDSWMAKNARPLTLLSLLGFLFVIIIIDSLTSVKIQFDVKSSYIDLLQALLITVVAAYFGGRSIEKFQKIKSNPKD